VELALGLPQAGAVRRVDHKDQRIVPPVVMPPQLPQLILEPELTNFSRLDHNTDYFQAEDRVPGRQCPRL
jgi:hypothetical protein